jgi:hypothetical protein
LQFSPLGFSATFFSALVRLNLLYLVLQVSLEKVEISSIELKLRIGVLSIFMVCCGLRVKYLSMQLLLKSLGVKIGQESFAVKVKKMSAGLFSETIATKSNHFLVQNDLLPGTVAGTNYPYL